MNCANHNDVAAVAYCRNCGKPLCSNCTRDVQGVIYCETCLAQKMHGVPGPGASFPSYAPGVIPPVPTAGPNAALAGVLAGLFPFGVGAVYTGQYAKGLAHLVIMTGLIWGETIIHNGGINAVLGIGIGFFYIYQIIDAVRSAWAIRLGQPVPDPFGLARMFSAGDATQNANVGTYATPAASYAPSSTPAYVEPPPEPSRIPTAAIVLIGLGVLFLLETVGFFDINAHRVWPFFLIGLGIWLFAVRANVIPGRLRRRDGRRRGFTGPAVLVTVGFLFLIESFNGPDWGRTWPVLLLVIGGVRLWEAKMFTDNTLPPQPPSAPGAASSTTTSVVYTPPAPPPSPGEVNNG
jgi:hypothetical protein